MAAPQQVSEQTHLCGKIVGDLEVEEKTQPSLAIAGYPDKIISSALNFPKECKSYDKCVNL